ncbi:iron-sulfur cluster assembly scaffold protein [Sphingomonas arenae]|uniref:iron-sulfur cluster assembly scaffold protein n=1 Tax=Sphingomonas arenae TaxID=2812555 RepID=UPI001967C63A|nr:iron-sulfur cluster assembly scaffold protein [Sphingomonas arenae]
MNTPLYTTDILRLAASLPPFEPLADASGAAEKRSATCGSTIRAEVLLDREGRVAELRQRVNACAFGQASAALTQAAAEARSLEELGELRRALGNWLGGAGEAGVFAPLEPARSRMARHSAMLLPLDAVIAAVEEALTAEVLLNRARPERSAAKSKGVGSEERPSTADLRSSAQDERTFSERGTR